MEKDKKPLSNQNDQPLTRYGYWLYFYACFVYVMLAGAYNLYYNNFLSPLVRVDQLTLRELSYSDASVFNLGTTYN